MEAISQFNKRLKKFLSDKNVKFIHGKVFLQRSQGWFERLHHTLKIKLICMKINKGDNFDLIKANNNISFNFNNTIQDTIKYKPIEIFYTTSDEILKKSIYKYFQFF